MLETDVLELSPSDYRDYVHSICGQSALIEADPAPAVSLLPNMGSAWFQGRAATFRNLARRSSDAGLVNQLDELAVEFEKIGLRPDGQPG